jgi:hypothetical protein
MTKTFFKIFQILRAFVSIVLLFYPTLMVYVKAAYFPCKLIFKKAGLEPLPLAGTGENWQHAVEFPLSAASPEYKRRGNLRTFQSLLRRHRARHTDAQS